MSVDQLEAKLMELPTDQRREFARWFYDHEFEITEAEDDADISPESKAELLRRIQEFKANPAIAQPVPDDWAEQMKKRIANARAHQTPAV